MSHGCMWPWLLSPPHPARDQGRRGGLQAGPGAPLPCGGGRAGGHREPGRAQPESRPVPTALARGRGRSRDSEALGVQTSSLFRVVGSTHRRGPVEAVGAHGLWGALGLEGDPS